MDAAGRREQLLLINKHLNELLPNLLPMNDYNIIIVSKVEAKIINCWRPINCACLHVQAWMCACVYMCV